jgi:hypothetical protein
MVDTKIGSSSPRTIDTNSIGGSTELEVPPQIPTMEDKISAHQEDSFNKSGAESKAFMDIRGDLLRKVLDGQLGSVSHNLPPGVMQFGKTPLAAPDFAKKIADTKLTDDQKAAKAELEKSPAWKVLTDAQKYQITQNLSKVSDQKLKDEVSKTSERFKAIETLSGRGAWGQLSPAQQAKISDKALKLSGNQLKTEVTNTGGKFDEIEKMSQHSSWGVLNPDQKTKLTDPVMNQAGDKLKNHLTQSKDKLDALDSFGKQPSWNTLQPAQQQAIADHIFKTKPENLKQTTQNVQQTIDFVANLKNNKVDDQKTLDKLLKYEAQNPKGFPKMAANFTEAADQINNAKDKKVAAEDVRDMMNFTLDKTVGSKGGADVHAEKADVAGRFLRQYKKDPNDFHKFRDQLNATPGTTLLTHWHHKDMIGMNIYGNKPVTDSDLSRVTIPAGEQTRYKHAIGNLLEREGKYDDMNAYDDGIISIGFRQWTTHEGSMVEPLEAFKKANPTKFAELLPGISFTKNPNTISYNGKPLTIGNGNNVKGILDNLSQSEYMELSKMFNKAGKDPDFQAAQLQVGVNRANAVLAMPVGSHKIGDYIKSDRAFGHVYSFDPGRPGFTNKSFADGVKDVAKDFGLTDAAPSRQQLLDQLKLKLEGDPAKKIEPDKDFTAKLETNYGKDFVDKLKTDAGRADYLEKQLTKAFKENFLKANVNRFGVKDTKRFEDRFKATEKYYDKL